MAETFHSRLHESLDTRGPEKNMRRIEMMNLLQSKQKYQELLRKVEEKADSPETSEKVE
jgi:hypothetical protein